MTLNLQYLMYSPHPTVTQQERKTAYETQVCGFLAEAAGLITDTVSKVRGSPDPLGVGVCVTVWGNWGLLNAFGVTV